MHQTHTRGWTRQLKIVSGHLIDADGEIGSTGIWNKYFTSVLGKNFAIY